jgi:hypothetical protein
MNPASDLHDVHHAVGKVITADNPVMLLPKPGSTVRVVTVITWQSSRMTYLVIHIGPWWGGPTRIC